MKIKKRRIILMTAMTLIAVAGLAVGEPSSSSLFTPSP